MLTPVAGQGGGFDTAEASALRILPRARRAGGAPEGRRQATLADLQTGPRARRGCWSTARCATSWACGAHRWVYTGGAPLGPDTSGSSARSASTSSRSGGSTELAGLASLQPDGEADPDTVGRVTPGSDVRIAEDGEVLIRSAAVFKGYYKEPDATRETMTDDGWLRSGDSGLSTAAAISSSSIAPRIAASSPTARRSPRNLSRNKLKFSPSSPKRSLLAIAFHLSRRSSQSI